MGDYSIFDAEGVFLKGQDEFNLRTRHLIGMLEAISDEFPLMKSGLSPLILLLRACLPFSTYIRDKNEEVLSFGLGPLERRWLEILIENGFLFEEANGEIIISEKKLQFFWTIVE